MRLRILTVAVGVSLLGLAGAALAGGQQLSAEVSADGHSILVRTFRCGAPSSLALSGMAEGLVDGQRRTIPLKIGPATETGVFHVPRQWPEDGSWILTFTVAGPHSASALVELAPGPGLRVVAQESSYTKPTPKRVEAALRASR